jgi:hypothetical protein
VAGELLYRSADVVAREQVDEFVTGSGRLVAWMAQNIAYEAMRQIENAKLTGALPGEVGFAYEVGLKAFLR